MARTLDRPSTQDARRALRALLEHPRYEVLPLERVEESVRAYVPVVGTRVTVTASPRKGLEPTLALAERLAAAGYNAVPHLSARLVRDRRHLDDVLMRLQASGVRELFVPAGDAPQPAGEFRDAAQLLEAMANRRSAFDEIGITGYPESHSLISDEATIRAMFAKAPLATCIISQICFDAGTIDAWIGQVRRRGTHLPIWIGVPGVIDYAKLVRVSMKIGLGESARFLRLHSGWMRRVVTRQFKPDGLIGDLRETVVRPEANLAGFHFYTFNEVRRTERWRQEMLGRLEGDQ